MDEYGCFSIVFNMESDCIIFFVVFFSGDECIVGKEVKNSSKFEFDNVVDMVKCFMGKFFEFVFIYNEKNYILEEIFLYIIKKLV